MANFLYVIDEENIILKMVYGLSPTLIWFDLNTDRQVYNYFTGPHRIHKPLVCKFLSFFLLPNAPKKISQIFCLAYSLVQSAEKQMPAQQIPAWIKLQSPCILLYHPFHHRPSGAGLEGETYQ